MRIVIVHYTNYVIGGAEVYISRVIKKLLALGHKVAFFYEIEKSLTNIKDLPKISSEQEFCWSVEKLGAVKAIAELKKWQPEIIFSHILLDLSLEETLQNLAKSVHFIHSYEAICVNSSKLHTFPVLNSCKKSFDWRCLISFFPLGCGQNNYPIKRYKLVDLWNSYRKKKQRLSLLKNYDLIITLSNHMKKEFSNYGLDKIIVGYEPFNINSFPKLINFEDRKNFFSNIKLLFLSRHEISKGGHYLIEALPIVAERLSGKIFLTMANDGPKKDVWQKQANLIMKKYSNIYIEFLGFLDELNIKNLLKTSDLLVVPSLWPEPFGLIGIEAAMEELPVVAFNSGGVSDWLKDGFNGYLVDSNPPTAEKLANAIIKCLANPNIYNNLKRNSQLIGQHFNFDNHLKILVDNLEKLLLK
ncbi:MAG: glycosyltransferase family 4 protein [Blastocatellia bacterium]